MINQDENNLDNDFDDDEFAEEDSWDDSGFDDEEDAAQPGKKKSGGLIMGLLFLGIIGGGVYVGKDHILPMLGMDAQMPPVQQSQDMNQPPGMQTAQNPFDQNPADMGMPNDNNGLPPIEEMEENAPSPFDAGTMNEGLAENDPIFGRDNESIAGMQGGVGFPPQPEAPEDANPATAATANDLRQAEQDSVPITFGSDQNTSNDMGIPPMEANDSAMEMDSESPFPSDESFGENPFATSETETSSIDGNDIPEMQDMATDMPQSEQVPLTSEQSNVLISELEQEVAALKQEVTELEELESNLDKAMKENITLKEEISSLETELKEARSAAVAVTPKKATRTTATRKPSAKSSSVVTPSPKSWVLRSAKPGEAWISEKGDNEIRQIKVGDNLGSMGVVQAIEFDTASGWSVKTSKGKITQ